MAVNDLATSSRYNQLQSRINQVLGTGTGEFGYGQVVESTAKNTASLINAVDMQQIRRDIQKVYLHQNGIAAGSNTLPNVNSNDQITNAVYEDYESVVSDLYTDKNIIDSSQLFSQLGVIVSNRNTPWAGANQVQSIFHEISLTFNSVDHRRHFFNSGGTIRFDASITNYSGLKGNYWFSLLDAIEVVNFNYDATSANTGTTAPIGNFDLTDTYTTLYANSGTGSYAYSDNYYSIKGRGAQTSNVIEFLIEFYDGTINELDESVIGSIQSKINHAYAKSTSANGVTAIPPIYRNIRTL